MNPKDYWEAAHVKYSQKDWITKPTIFATQAVKYFPKKGALLELGAGQGQDSLFFAKAGYEVTATDFSPFALDRLRSKITPDLFDFISVQLLDLTHPLTFPPESFEIVYSHLALHYFDLKRTRELFNEIFETLKPGGVFATITNTIADPEVKQAKKIDEAFYENEGITKRYFSPQSLSKFTSGFKTLLLDNKGETYKDEL